MRKAREIEEHLCVKYGVDAFLTGSLVTGLNIPGNADYDYVIPAESPRRFFELKAALLQDFDWSPANRELADYAVFRGHALGEKVDIALMVSPKAHLIRYQQDLLRRNLTEERKRGIIAKKSRLKNLWIFSRKFYNRYKRRIAARLGMPRYRRDDLAWPELDTRWPSWSWDLEEEARRRAEGDDRDF